MEILKTCGFKTDPRDMRPLQMRRKSPTVAHVQYSVAQVIIRVMYLRLFVVKTEVFVKML